jgi:ankyrin repeat protein
VEVLIALVNTSRADPEKKDYSGLTPLLAALRQDCFNWELPAILTLMDLGAGVKAVDNDGNGVFHVAIKGFSSEAPEELISRLCAAGANIDQTNNKGEAPIHLTKVEITTPSSFMGAQLQKQTSWFEALLAAGAGLTASGPETSRTPLFNWISKSICDTDGIRLPEVLETFSRHGLSLHVTDGQGRTLLHAVARHCRYPPRPRIELLLGLDLSRTDQDGNTIWHEAALASFTALYKTDDEATEAFIPHMRLDPKQPNFHGLTPLHILSSKEDLNSTTAFNKALALYSDANIADKDGVTPLHLASTFSEHLVKRLLIRGAGPSCATNEGCNALHLAAKCRMPNVVGLLMEDLRARPSKDLETIVNRRDRLGRTPLYYACLAASCEMAKLLIDSGAVMEAATYESSPWRALAHHEAESDNWHDTSYAGDKRAGAVLLADNSRPTGEHDLRYQQPRLDELVMLLTNTAAPNQIFINKARDDAASLSANFTVECLLRSSKLCSPAGSLAREAAELPCVIAALDRRLAGRTHEHCPSCKVTRPRSVLQLAWITNDYHQLSAVLLAQNPPPSGEEAKKILRTITSHGFAAVLCQIVAEGGAKAVDDRSWLDESDTSQNTGFGSSSRRKEQPLLLGACRRSISNMGVIRVLVEEGEQDPSAQQQFEQSDEQRYQSSQSYAGSPEGESTLHALVRGEHWWQVYEGLPFLLQRGACTELRDAHGKTPLSAALDKCGSLTFDKLAVELLIQYGADVNATDFSGSSCLAKACSDRENDKSFSGPRRDRHTRRAHTNNRVIRRRSAPATALAV